jgi:flagellar protein FliO/FliZ
MTADTYWRFILALLLVVALIFAAAWVARRLGLAGRLAAVGGKKRRLAVVEVLPLDGKRRLVLLRRDGTEHLVLLGLGGDLLLEGGIGDRAGGADFAATLESVQP